MRKADSAGIKTYRFFTNQREVHIPAESLNAAKHTFQERFGYWPA